MKKFIDALNTWNPDEIHAQAKKEASRQVGAMNKWLEFKKKTDPEGLEASGVAGAVKKAGQYRFKIYNHNKVIDDLDEKLAVAEANLDVEKVDELRNKKAEKEAEQYMYCWRILKIFCIVSSRVSLLVPKDESERPDQRDLYLSEVD